MPRTPDQFPGERLEESIQFDIGTSLPIDNGDVLYASGTMSGSGFFFREEGKYSQVVNLPSQVGQILMCVVEGGKFIPAMPITSTSGWLINLDGTLIVSASL